MVKQVSTVTLSVYTMLFRHFVFMHDPSDLVILVSARLEFDDIRQ